MSQRWTRDCSTFPMSSCSPIWAARPLKGERPRANASLPTSACGQTATDRQTKSWKAGNKPRVGCATLRNRAEIPLPQAVHPFYITQSRKGAKKRLARSVIAQSYFGDDAHVAVIPAAYNNLVHCHRNSIRAGMPALMEKEPVFLIKTGPKLGPSSLRARL